MSKPRPVITRVPDNFQYNQLNKIIFSMPGDKSKHRRGLLDFLFKKVEVVLMDFGFATHGVHSMSAFPTSSIQTEIWSL